MSQMDGERPASWPPIGRAEGRAGESAHGMLAVIRRLGGNLLARRRQDGPDCSAQVVELRRPAQAPEASLTPETGLPIARVNVPTGDQLLERLDMLYPRPLTEAQEQAVRELKPDARLQVMATLVALGELKARRLSTAQYMLRVMQAAAQTAGTDRALFVALVRLSLGGDPGRRSGEASASEVLERAFHALRAASGSAPYGFNPNVHDISPSRSVPQLISEALEPHRSRWGLFAGKLAELRTGQRTAGDIRCELFGKMLGRALREGRLYPLEALELTRWALLEPKPGEAPPPWGTAPVTNGFLTPSFFRLDAWVKSYQAAQLSVR